MANLRSISLDELSKRVSEAIIDDCGSLMDSNRIANAALYHLCEKRVDAEEVDVEDLVDAIEECFHEAIYEDRIEKIITQSLKNAGVTNDPPVVQAPNTGEIAESVAAAVKTAVSELRPQPSLLSMEVTALREQIMANCRIIHSLHDGMHNVKQPASVHPELIIASDDVNTNFRACVVRTVPGSGVAITIETGVCATTEQALDWLYRISCVKLTKCRASAKNNGGALANWGYMRL